MNYKIEADGGFKAGKGYGSFNIYQDGKLIFSENRIELAEAKTSNQAEYWILIEAVEYLTRLCNPGEASKLDIFTDSELVVKQLNQAYKVGKMKELFGLLERKLERFTWDVQWYERENSVRLFGH